MLLLNDNKYFNISILISNTVNINDYNPHKQNSLLSFIIFKYKIPKTKNFKNQFSRYTLLSWLGILQNPYAALHRLLLWARLSMNCKESLLLFSPKQDRACSFLSPRLTQTYLSLQNWQEAQSTKAHPVEIFLQQKEENIVQNHSWGNHSSSLGLFSLEGRCVLCRKLSVKHHRSPLGKGELSSTGSAFTATLIVVIITIIVTTYHTHWYNTQPELPLCLMPYMSGTGTVLNTVRITSFNLHQNLRSQIGYYCHFTDGKLKMRG